MFRLILIVLSFALSGAFNEMYGRTFLNDTSGFYSIVDKTQFDTLRGEDFVWMVFMPINDRLGYMPFEQRSVFVSNLSEKQRAFFYVVELERAVYGGGLGFVNYYYNYSSYYQETIKGLHLIKDTAMLKVLEGANRQFLRNGKAFDDINESGAWKYNERLFRRYDRAFLDKHKETINLLEEFVRDNAIDFVRFKDR